jgi:hypothetical protein
MLKELGDAINDSVSESDRVHETIEKLRDHGYRLFLNLDARIGIERDEAFSADSEELAEEEVPPASFRIDFRDLRLLKSLGIDPTRKVRSRRVSRPGSRPAATSASRPAALSDRRVRRRAAKRPE